MERSTMFGLMFTADHPNRALHGQLVRVCGGESTEDTYDEFRLTDDLTCREFLTTSVEYLDNTLNGFETFGTEEMPSRGTMSRTHMVPVKMSRVTERKVTQDQGRIIRVDETHTVTIDVIFGAPMPRFKLAGFGTTSAAAPMLKNAVLVDGAVQPENAYLVETDMTLEQVAALRGQRVFVNNRMIELMGVAEVHEQLVRHLNGKKGLMLFSMAGHLSAR